MATKVLNTTATGATQTTVVSWLALANGDDGAPSGFSHYGDKSVQVIGTFGAAGNLRIEGSNDGSNWGVLTDPQGNALDFTAAKIEAVSELTRFIRPRVTAGDGTTSLSVFMFLKSTP